MPKRNPFKTALAARLGDIEPDELKGAARRLYADKTLTNDDLSTYTEGDTSSRQKKFGGNQNQRRYKY